MFSYEQNSWIKNFDLNLIWIDLNQKLDFDIWCFWIFWSLPDLQHPQTSSRLLSEHLNYYNRYFWCSAQRPRDLLLWSEDVSFQLLWGLGSQSCHLPLETSGVLKLPGLELLPLTPGAWMLIASDCLAGVGAMGVQINPLLPISIAWSGLQCSCGIRLEPDFIWNHVLAFFLSLPCFFTPF